MLKAVGREQGPDYMLKILPEDALGQPGLLALSAVNVLTTESSITEVLNVVSYLCSTTRDGSLIDTNNSVRDPAGANIGEHAAGLYTGAAATAIGNTFMNANQGGAGSIPLFDITTLAPPGDVANAVIPVGILRRTVQAQPVADPLWVVQAAAPQVDTAVRVVPIMSDCVKQMINILVKTREIFGPKGWTALFNQVKGGGAGSKHAKRTHRQHRRRYSSKQY
jgi:hypothetical protein